MGMAAVDQEGHVLLFRGLLQEMSVVITMGRACGGQDGEGEHDEQANSSQGGGGSPEF